MKKYGRIMGYFDGTVPNLWVTDADIIKSVFVKDFDHFVNRRVEHLRQLCNILFNIVASCHYSGYYFEEQIRPKVSDYYA